MLRQTRIIPRQQCVHVVALREKRGGYAEYEAKGCRRGQNGSGMCDPKTDADDDGADCVLRTSTPLPFVSPQFCYRVVANKVEGLNNTVHIIGCLDIKCDVSQTTHAASLHHAVLFYGDKNMKKKTETCLSRQRDDKNFDHIVWTTFRGNDPVIASVKRSLVAAVGWFSRQTRGLGATLYCMGFCDRVFVSRELLADETTLESWFLALGDADLKWQPLTDIDHRYEGFGTYMRSFHGRHQDFITSIEALIRLNPKRFFCTNTRPMALRALGGLQPNYFVAYCANMEPPIILDETHLVSVELENIDNEIFVEEMEYDSVCATLSIRGQPTAFPFTVQRCALTLLRSLVVLQKRNKLTFLRENELAAKIQQNSRKLVNWRTHDSGDTGYIREVHIFCATRNISFVYEKLEERMVKQGENATVSFVCGKGLACDAHVYFRDAHLLSANVLSHLMWRLSKRVNFTGLTMTDRCSDDRSYHNLLWCFVRRLKEGDVQSHISKEVLIEPTENMAIASLSNLNIGHLQGVCVVPMARDACCVMDAAPGDYAFIVDPPLFGVVKKENGQDFLINTCSGLKTVPRFIYSKPNVMKCKQTSTAGYLIPASSLLAMQTNFLTMLPSLTLLLPKSLNVQWKDDMITLTRSVAKHVTVVDVIQYDFTTDTDSRIDRLVHYIQEHPSIQV
jgi:hypothetical protein